MEYSLFEESLDRALEACVSAVEIESGGYPGRHQSPADELLESETMRKETMKAIHSRWSTI